jgi:hypothetical protein
VDLKLEGDLEISRKHCEIERLASGSFAVTCEGRNSLEVAGRELPQGDRTEVNAGQTIRSGLTASKLSQDRPLRNAAMIDRPQDRPQGWTQGGKRHQADLKSERK